MEKEDVPRAVRATRRKPVMITRKATAERQTVTEGDRDRRECVRSEVEVRFKRGARTDAADHAD